MKRLSKKNKRVFLEILVISLFLVIVVASLLTDCAVLHIPDFFKLSVKDVENLFFTLFAVQASVSTMSIAVVSIITGLANEYVLGMSISSYIMHHKPVILKHNRLIMTNLSLCVCNYIFLACNLFNACIALFVVSMIITILMTREIYVIFLGKNLIREEMQTYICENYNSDILNNLGTEISSAIEIQNSLVIKEDFEAIRKIFETEVERNQYQKTEIVEQLSTIVCNSFEKLSYKHNGQNNNQCLLLICSIYRIANKSAESPLHLDIWDRIVEEFIRSLKDISYEQLKDGFAYYALHKELYKNLKGRTEKEVFSSNLKYYSCWVYSNLIKGDSQLKNSERIDLCESIYEMLSLDLYYSPDLTSEVKTLLIHELCNLHKVMIDNNDCASVKRYFFDKLKYNYEKSEQSIVCVITLIYLYYLSSRESLVEGSTLQENAKAIISENSDSCQYFYYYFNLNKMSGEQLMFVRTVLHNWEYMNENECKYPVMDKTVDDFFIFSALEMHWNEQPITNILNVISPNSMFSLYARYFPKGEDDSFKKIYSDFICLFAKSRDESSIQEKTDLIRDVLNKRYVLEILEKGETEKITPIQEEELGKIIKSEVEEISTEKLACFSFKNDSDDNVVEKQDHTIFSCYLYNDFFHNQGLVRDLKEHIVSSVINTFIRSIYANIHTEKISHTDKNKQEKLISSLEELPIHPSVVIGNRTEFWDEEDKNLLKEYTKKMTQINYPGGYNSHFILDEKLVEFCIENIRVEFSDLEWEYIEKKCKPGKDGFVNYNVTNDIYIPFEKTELKNHISKTEKLMTVYGNVKVRLSSDKVGAGIIITM